MVDLGYIPPRPMSRVQMAEEKDLDGVIAFLKQMRPEIGDGHADEERLVAWAHHLVRRNGGVALIVKGDTLVEASLGMIVENPILRNDHHLRVAWNCVLPEYRNTGHAKSLIAMAKFLADGLGRPLYLEEFTADPQHGRVKLARRHMAPVGHLFAHVPA